MADSHDGMRELAVTVTPAAISSSRMERNQETKRALSCLRQPASLISVFVLAVSFCLVLYARFGSTPRLWSALPLVVVLSLIVVLDVRTKVIPDFLTLPAMAYAFLVAGLLESPPLTTALLGCGLGAAAVLLAAVVTRGAIGGGDIKLACVLGAALGWEPLLSVLVFSQIAGAALVIAVLVTRRANLREPFPIGAIISLTGTVMLIGAP